MDDAQQAAPAKPPPERVERLEIANALVLAISGLAISWATYQASLWDGEQAAAYAQASAQRIESTRLSAMANTLETVEVGMFSGWLDATVEHDQTRADFYARRFPPDFRNAFNAWILTKPLTNPAAPHGPMMMPEYKPLGRAKAIALEAKAATLFEKGQRDNDISDAFMQGQTILSSALFFAGIGQVFQTRKVRWGLLVLAAVICVLGLARVALLPTITLITAATAT